MAVYSKDVKLNIPAIDFELKGVDDKMYCLDDFKDYKILVIIFMCNHCPYVKAVIKRLVDLQEKLLDKEVRFVGINPNDDVTYPEDSFENMKIFYKENKMNFPYLRDETQEIAKAYDAVCTPDIYVFDSNRRLKYRGRIDDNWKDEEQVRNKELERAINLLLEGKEIDFQQNPSMGCSIKWK
ncbi:MAG: thioredoxin family protein [Ignavibacteria bacterium]|nr:thioredoxin family protein [Ignavibacteria bacterium]